MPISHKQKQILAFPYTDYDALICDGAIRSGKTVFMIISFIDDAMRRYNNQRFGICGKTVDSTIKNIIVPYLSLTYVKKYNVKWRRADKVLVVSQGKTENIFEVFGGKDESSYSLIQGRTLAGVLFDEVALQPRSFVEQAMARCSVDGSKIWFNCNPEGPSHWFYQEWVCKPEEHNAVRLHFELEDNPSLSQRIIDRYKSMYTGVFYDRYIKGLWVAAEGVIYDLFARNTEAFLCDDVSESLMMTTIGIDYGASKSRTTFKATGFSRGYKTVYALDEEDIEGIHEPEEIYKAFEAFYLRVVSEFGTVLYVYADYGALGQVITNGLQRYMQRKGYPVIIRDCTKGRIVERIELFNQLMAQGRFKILRRCENLIQAFRTALWDSKHPDERLDDGTTDIDSLDACEYSVFSFYNNLI